MPIAVTVVAAADPTQPHQVTVTGLTPSTQVITFARSYSSHVEWIAGTFTADSGGIVAQPDYLYPFDTPVTYLVYNSDKSQSLAQSGVVPAVSSQGTPWIRDVLFPSLRYSSVRIVDLGNRQRAGRINPYYAVGQPYALTIGDVRSGSTGSFSLFCVDHNDRDTVLYAMSTGNPCVLRIPHECQKLFDEMVFTPNNISEQRFGKSGACTLTVDFVEVLMSEVATFQPITYAQQKDNAAAVALQYGNLNNPTTPPFGLSLNFIGYDYRALRLSPTGITP